MLQQRTMHSSGERGRGTAMPAASVAAPWRMLRNPVPCRRSLSLRLRAAKGDRKLEERQARQWGKGTQQLQPQQPAAGAPRQEQEAAVSLPSACCGPGPRAGSPAAADMQGPSKPPPI